MQRVPKSMKRAMIFGGGIRGAQLKSPRTLP
jgi:hypothetical protein